MASPGFSKRFTRSRRRPLSRQTYQTPQSSLQAVQTMEDDELSLRRDAAGSMPGAKQSNRARMEYEHLAQSCAYTDPSQGYVYPAALCPGEGLFKFLVPRRNPVRPSESDKLQVWMPDTIVFPGEDKALWLYSNAKGQVEVSTTVTEANVLAKLGNPSHEDDYVVMRKQSNAVPWVLDPSLHVSAGNSLSVVTSRDLRDLLRPSRAGENFVLQRIVKCKGPQAFISRAVWRRDKAPFAWAISNRVPFLADTDKVEDRFCTRPSTLFATSIHPVSGRGAAEPAAIAAEVARFLSRQFGHPLSECVVDVLKDDAGRWWLLQVKAYQLLGGPRLARVPRPPVLSTGRRRKVKAVAPRAIQRGTAATTSTHSLSHVPLPPSPATRRSGTGSSPWPPGATRRPVRRPMSAGGNPASSTGVLTLAGNGLRGIDAAGDLSAKPGFMYAQEGGIGLLSSAATPTRPASARPASASARRRTVRCKLCQADYLPENLPFKMSWKMIRETACRLAQRLPPDALARQPWLLREDLHTDTAPPRTPDTSRLYQAFPVCSLCYEVHQRELKLVDVEAAFADIVGVVPPASAVVRTSVPASLAHATPPPNMTLCRLLVVLHSLHDVPSSLFAQPRDDARSTAAAAAEKAAIVAEIERQEERVMDLEASVAESRVAYSEFVEAQVQAEASRHAEFARQGELEATGAGLHFLADDTLGRKAAPGVGYGFLNPAAEGLPKQGAEAPDGGGGDGDWNNTATRVDAALRAHRSEVVDRAAHTKRARAFKRRLRSAKVALRKAKNTLHRLQVQQGQVAQRWAERATNRRTREYRLSHAVLGHETDTVVSAADAVRDGRGTVTVPIGRLFVYHFLAPDTPQHSPLTSSSGLVTLLQAQKHVEVALKRDDGTAAAPTPVGSAHLPLKQFKSSFVVKLDVYAPLALTIPSSRVGGQGKASLCSLKATVGIERTRAHMDLDRISQQLRPFHGVDPLPAEWMAAIPGPHLVGPRDPEAAASPSPPPSLSPSGSSKPSTPTDAGSGSPQWEVSLVPASEDLPTPAPASTSTRAAWLGATPASASGDTPAASRFTVDDSIITGRPGASPPAAGRPARPGSATPSPPSRRRTVDRPLATPPRPVDTSLHSPVVGSGGAASPASQASPGSRTHHSSSPDMVMSEQEAWPESVWTLNVDFHTAHNLQTQPGQECSVEYSLLGRRFTTLAVTTAPSAMAGATVGLVCDSVDNLPLDVAGAPVFAVDASFKQQYRCALTSLRAWMPPMEVFVNVAGSDGTVQQFTCVVPLDGLFSHRQVEGTFSLTRPGVASPRVLPDNSFPPYLSTTVHLHRIGPQEHTWTLPKSVVSLGFLRQPGDGSGPFLPPVEVLGRNDDAEDTMDAGVLTPGNVM